jgi:hypothetical protein
MTNSTTPFKDRLAWLIVFGILEILAGVLNALFMMLMICGLLFNAQKNGVSINSNMLIVTLAIYSGLTVTLVWLGIGSIKAQRWARALLLILAWYVLIMGILIVGSLLWMLLRSPLKLGPVGGIIIAIQATIFFIIPAIGVWFYGDRHVKATCEARNPAPSWTDACPLPVLASCLFVILGVMTLVPVAFVRPAFPFFGQILIGIPATILFLVLSALGLYTAWKMYRLTVGGWWLQVACVLFLGVSGTLTCIRHDTMEFYRAAGYTGQQLA